MQPRRDAGAGGGLLRTARLQLRHWAEADLDAFLDLYSRWEVVRWLGPKPRRPLRDRGEARDRLARWHEREAALERPFGLWAVVPHGVAEPVGTALLLPLADARGPTGHVEIGWHLHPQSQGRGLATDAAAALLAAAADAGIPRVLALSEPENARSQAVAQRLGMVDEGLTERWFGLLLRQHALALSGRPGVSGQPYS